MTNIDNTPAVIPVRVKSAWLSKVNWLQVISTLATCATGLISATNLPPLEAVAATAAVAAVGDFATGIVKTFFTTTVTPSSAAKVS